MPPCAIGRPGDEAMHRDEGGVDDRQQHDQRREDQRRRRAGPLRRPGGERQAADREAEEQAPGVAHEHATRAPSCAAGSRRRRRAARRRASAASIRPDAANSAAIASAEMPETPAARPSMLSRRFSAVESATSHRMASSVSSQTMPVTGSRSPNDTATVAMTSWAVSFVCGVERSAGRRAGRARRTRLRRSTRPASGGARCPAEHEADGGAGGDGQTAQQRYRTPVPAIAPRSARRARGDAPAGAQQNAASRRDDRRGQRGHDRGVPSATSQGPRALRIMRESCGAAVY